MKKLQFTVHSLSKNRPNNNFNFKKKLVHLEPAFFILLSILFFYIPKDSSAKASSVRIAIIDTGFCPEKVNPKIIINSPIDLTNSVFLNCKNIDKNSARLHGEHVLNEFLRFYEAEKNNRILEIFPLIIFDAKGNQKEKYWLKAIEWIKKNNINFVISASELITPQKIINQLPALWFVAAGRISTGVKENTLLFPINLAPQDNLFIIGDYFAGLEILYDQSLIFKDKIDFYFPSGNENFKGSSRAVAEGSARALNLCPIENIRSCLNKLSKELIDNISKLKIKTY